MTGRPYVAGVAIAATLLLGVAVGIEWIDVGTDGAVNQTGQPAVQAPAGAMPSTTQASSPGRSPAPGTEDDVEYVYIDGGYYSKNAFPWYPVFTSFRFQELYLASEIGRSGTISQMALWLTGSDQIAYFPNISVKLCHTSLTSLTTGFVANYHWNDPFWVYHSTSPLQRGTGAANDWDVIEFTTPFEYNGADNLLVEVTWQGTAYGSYPCSWSFPALGNRRCYAYNADTLVQTGSADNYLYNARIGFQPAPACGATIVFVPHKVPVKGHALWLACYIELPTGFDVNDIVPGSVAIVAINGVPIPKLYQKPEDNPVVGDNIPNGIPDLKVRFDEQVLLDILVAAGYGAGDEPVLTVTGDIDGYGTFVGSDAIELVGPGHGGGQAGFTMALQSSIDLTPNPAKNGRVTLMYALPKAEPFDMTVLDVSGRAVRTQQVSASSRTGTLSIDLGDLNAGVYVVRITGPDLTATRKLVVQR
jgi:hypothetical protein